MKVKFYPRRKSRKLWLSPQVDPDTVQKVKKAIDMIMGTNYDSYPSDLPLAYFGEELITPRVLIREGYSPVDDNCLFGLWHLPSGATVPYSTAVYDLVSGG